MVDKEFKNVKYWYLTTIITCPVCGSEDVIKERMYTPKPENFSDRIIIKENYDWCDI